MLIPMPGPEHHDALHDGAGVAAAVVVCCGLAHADGEPALGAAATGVDGPGAIVRLPAADPRRADRVPVEPRDGGAVRPSAPSAGAGRERALCEPPPGGGLRGGGPDHGAARWSLGGDAPGRRTGPCRTDPADGRARGGGAVHAPARRRHARCRAAGGVGTGPSGGVRRRLVDGAGWRDRRPGGVGRRRPVGGGALHHGP